MSDTKLKHRKDWENAKQGDLVYTDDNVYQGFFVAMYGISVIVDTDETSKDCLYDSWNKNRVYFIHLADDEKKEETQNVAKHDSGKLHLSYVPSSLIYAVAYIREYGNAKYHDPNNWLDVEWQRYYEALLRHVELFKADPKGYDDESGLPHLWHIACNVAFLCHMLESMYCEKLGIKVGEQLDFYKISPYFRNINKECN